MLGPSADSTAACSRLSGYSSSSSLSFAPDANTTTPDDATEEPQEGLFVDASKSVGVAAQEEDAAVPPTADMPKSSGEAVNRAVDGFIDEPGTGPAMLSVDNQVHGGGPSSSQANFLPSSPTLGVQSRMLARTEPLSRHESRHSQQHTLSPSPPLVDGHDAHPTTPSPLEKEAAGLRLQLASVMANNVELLERNLQLTEDVATLKEWTDAITGKLTEAGDQNRVATEMNGADIGRLEQANEATRTDLVSVTKERDDVRVTLAAKNADVSAASKDVAALMAKVARSEHERATVASALEAEKAFVDPSFSRPAHADVGHPCDNPAQHRSDPPQSARRTGGKPRPYPAQPAVRLLGEPSVSTLLLTCPLPPLQRRCGRPRREEG